MTYILRLDTSPRGTKSLSRELADQVEQHLLELDKDLFVKTRDLSTTNLPHISNDTISGFYTSPDDMTLKLKEATALSDKLVHELKSANTLLISTPMYNFSLPSSLKAWIDQIVRINQTFSFDGNSFKGLVPVKRAVLVIAYGANGYSPNGDFAVMNFLEPYLISLMKFLGIEDTQVIRLEGTTGDSESLVTAQQQALEELSTLFIKES